LKKKLDVKKLKKIQEKEFSSKDIALLKKLKNKFTDKELQNILNSGFDLYNSQNRHINNINFSGSVIKFGVLTDTHIGSIFFKEKLFFKAIEMFEKEKCKFITHSGDVTDGLSNRQGHVYELTHIGFNQQLEYAINLFSKVKIPIYSVDGNHDRYYIKSAGAIIVKEIAKQIKNFTFLGHDIAEFTINQGIKICLWHGEDGSSYATSYRLQKIVESLTGGSKPNMIIAGHTHKHNYSFERNVHILSAGACSLQSSYMKSKRLANHAGFWIVDLTVNKKSIVKCKVEWFPFYV